jgi:DUF4097 and DUF4098 domain-containing protein YvlB
MKRTHSLAGLWFAVFFGLTSLSWAQQQDADHFHWTGKLASNQVLTIKNVNGMIDASGAAVDQIEVNAVKSGRDKDQVKVEVVNTGDGVTICAVYPGNACEGGTNWSTHVHDVRAKVDFTVRLPRNLRFNAQSVNGGIRAEEMGREVNASSVNGGVDVSTASWARAKSVNGSVHVRMGRADWPGTLKIETVNGSIELTLPENFSADVKFRSVNGRLNSEFPMTMGGNSGWSFGPKSVEGKIGVGGRLLDVSTVNGSLDIRKGSAGL